MRLLVAIAAIAMIAPAWAQDWVPVNAMPRADPRREAPAEAPIPAVQTPVEAPAAETPAEAPPPAVAVPSEVPPFPLPRPRPEPDATPTEATPEQNIAIEKAEPPEPRIYQTACPAVLMGQVEAKMLPPIEDNICRVQAPMSLSGALVNGRMVPVSGGVITDCAVATMLPQWATAVDGYLWSRESARLESIIVGTSYMCRPRNNVPGADVSEHGFADALDVVGFKLDDGRTVTVEAGWSDPLSKDGRLLRFAHDAACSLFTTTLGPEANALHRDHFHVDLGCHGKTCTARLCE